MSEPLFTLLPQIVDVCPDRPIVAAGGIADGRGFGAALLLGADGVLMGTRFYASQEAEGHREAKQRIVAAGSGQTVAPSCLISRAKFAGRLNIPDASCATGTKRTLADPTSDS